MVILHHFLHFLQLFHVIFYFLKIPPSDSTALKWHCRTSFLIHVEARIHTPNLCFFLWGGGVVKPVKSSLAVKFNVTG